MPLQTRHGNEQSPLYPLCKIDVGTLCNRQFGYRSVLLNEIAFLSHVSRHKTVSVLVKSDSKAGRPFISANFDRDIGNVGKINRRRIKFYLNKFPMISARFRYARKRRRILKRIRPRFKWISYLRRRIQRRCGDRAVRACPAYRAQRSKRTERHTCGERKSESFVLFLCHKIFLRFIFTGIARYCFVFSVYRRTDSTML